MNQEPQLHTQQEQQQAADNDDSDGTVGHAGWNRCRYVTHVTRVTLETIADVGSIWLGDAFSIRTLVFITRSKTQLRWVSLKRSHRTPGNSQTLLTRWGQVTHICVGKLTIIGSDNGLSPVLCQAINWTNAGKLLIEPLVTNFSDSLIKIQNFSFIKMPLKTLSAKWRTFCPGGDELTRWGWAMHIHASVNCITIGSYNGLSSVPRQAVIRTNAGLLLIRLLEWISVQFGSKHDNFHTRK